jgi:AcrR family transcriptional regulator
MESGAQASRETREGREPAVRAALKLLNAGGLEALTLRAIAAELGVKAPTLYWRFASKQDLVDEMASRVLADYAAELLAMSPRPETWLAWTQVSSVRFRAALLRYRDGARMVAGTHLKDPTIYGVQETALEIFDAAGVALAEAAGFLKTAHDYVIGFTIEEQAVISPAGERDPRYALSAREAGIDADRYPLARSIGPALFDNYDAGFARGLSYIVAGFAVGLPRDGKAWRDFADFHDL